MVVGVLAVDSDETAAAVDAVAAVRSVGVVVVVTAKVFGGLGSADAVAAVQSVGVVVGSDVAAAVRSVVVVVGVVVVAMAKFFGGFVVVVVVGVQAPASQSW